MTYAISIDIAVPVEFYDAFHVGRGFNCLGCG